MFKVTNMKNLKFIRQYVRDAEIEIKEVEEFSSYSNFLKVLKSASVKYIDVLEKLNADYISHVPIHRLIEKHELVLNHNGLSESTRSIQSTVVIMVLVVGTDIVGY